MSVLPIRTLGDPVLREPTRDVEHFDELLKRLHDDMLETMYQAPGVGLAAPQIGLSLRFFVFDVEGGKAPGALANPTIMAMEGEEMEDEGCLSIPNLWCPSPRATWVRIAGQDLRGEPLELEGEGLLARAFQHETDHLSGLLFIDRLSEEDRRQAMAQLREQELSGSRTRFRGRTSNPSR